MSIQIDRQVSAWLEKAKLRKTFARVSVMTRFLEIPGPISAEGLYQDLDATGNNIGVASVYRILREMEVNGFIRRDRTASMHKSVYILNQVGQSQSRYIFECVYCSTKSTVSDPALFHRLSGDAYLQGFQLPANVFIKSLCRTCKAAGHLLD
jgi:Fe2+ or Zn2+ uptake regulation protein